MVGMISGIAGQTNLLALKRHDRGGARRRGGAGLRGGGLRGEGAGRADRQGDRGRSRARSARFQGVTAQAVTAIGGITGRIREIDGVATSIAAAVEQQGAATQEIVRNVAQPRPAPAR